VRSYSHYEGTQVNEDDRAGSIGVEHPEVYTSEFDAKQKANHKPMKEHDIGVK
jgi:hypothetical protein